MNIIWFAILLFAFVAAVFGGRMEEVGKASFDSAKASVMLAIGLVGTMALWLGLMRVARDAGLTRVIARALRPLMTWLFPDVPKDHPAISAMVMNFAANMMGLGNAATPFGIKAMMELDKLNQHKGVATNAMALFLAINTSQLALLPTGVMGVRSALGSSNPGAIVITTWFATAVSTVVAITAAKLLCRLPVYSLPTTPIEVSTTKTDTDPNNTDAPSQDSEEVSEDEALNEIDGVEAVEAPESKVILFGQTTQRRAVTFAVGTISVFCAVYWLSLQMWSAASACAAGSEPLAWCLVVALIQSLGLLTIPLLMVVLILYGVARGVSIYQSFVEGAKEGFQVAIRIIPYLVAILVAVGMLRASGGLDMVIDLLRPLVEPLGMPTEVLPMALIRPLSGSGALGVMTETMKHHGPDSMIGYMVSTLNGSTETTFYVIAVYFGAVRISRIRHALPAGLLADLTGVVATIFICRMVF